ncbi:MAG: HEAT repeat domain-containing protein, partial [Thermoanaerobaculia bacterium]
EVARELTGTSFDRAVADVLLELAETPELSPELLPPLLLRLEQAYRRLLAGGRILRALQLVARVHQSAAGDGARPTAFRRSAERLAGRESLTALVLALPDFTEEALDIVPRLLDQLGPTAVRHLLGALAETDNRSLRHLLLDLLARLGPAVVRDATSLLGDSRWYVVRNVLLLLRRVGDPGSVPAVRKCADHPDLRVRLEAIRNLFAFDKEVPRELLRRALTHRDPRQAEAAMELAGEHGIVEAVEPIVAYLRAHDLLGSKRAVRLKALRALAAIGDPAALAGLERFRARFQLLPPALEERREIYRTLSSYPAAARLPWIESGLQSRDAEIRRLSEALSRLAEPSASSEAAS